MEHGETATQAGTREVKEEPDHPADQAAAGRGLGAHAVGG